MPRLIVMLCCAAALGGGVAACGSSSGGKTGTATATGAQFQARLNLARCFRAHGVNVPDPSPGGGPAEGGGAFRVLRQYPRSQITGALQACQQYARQAFPLLNMSPAQRAQFQQQLVKFAQCMRAHGVDVPDPTFNGNGGFGFGRAFRSVDRNSPAFQAASNACRGLRPRFGRAGAGG